MKRRNNKNFRKQNKVNLDGLIDEIEDMPVDELTELLKSYGIKFESDMEDVRMIFKCVKCGKLINELHQGGGLKSLTEGYCEECAKELNNKDLELLKAIKRGEDISKFI